MGKIKNNPIAHIPIEKIKFFQKELLNWYGENRRTFHWRKNNLTHYQYIIAEVLLQRTKAETAAKFYSKFIIDFPNWQSLANADIELLENYIKPLGLYRQRSKRLVTLAKEMVRRKGRLPRDRKELETIPYFGQYIANAIELIIYKKASPLIDVNMSRLVERFFGKRDLADIRNDPYLQTLSFKIIDHLSSKEINWAILDFSAIICKPRPNCKECKLNTYCIFSNTDCKLKQA